MAASQAPGASTHFLYGLTKRGFDLALGSLGLCATAPLLACIGLAIRACMGPPVLFRQTRVGHQGRVFELIKFRTMLPPRPGQTGPESDADRLTPLGRWLRSTSLDELPTLWNVLKGEMSLVGPRPLLVHYVSRYSSRQARRHDAKPGITGIAQINGRNAIPWDERLELDVWYVENRSFALDLKILLATCVRVFQRHGISHSGHATMPEFTGSEGGLGTSDPHEPRAQSF